MEKRKFILLALIVLSAVVIGLIIYFLVFYTFSRQSKSTVTTATPQPAEVLKISNVQPGAAPAGTSSAATVDLTEEDVGQVAKIFVERYGTYSNQGGSQQFDDLNLFTTAKMQAWLTTNTKETLAGLIDYKTSYIKKTQAVSAKTLSLDKTAGQATVLVSTRRTELSGDNAPKVINKDIKIELVKSGQRWLVDAAFWQ
jgi:hypothetical protein